MDGKRTFGLLVGNSIVASVTNNFVWFALTFWVYLETHSVVASSVIGGGYMMLVAVSALMFGTFVDSHKKRTAMLLSNCISLVSYLLAALVYRLSTNDSLTSLDSPGFWALVAAVLIGAISGNLRNVALSTTVTLLIDEDHRDRANGLIGMVTGVSFALTSVFSGLAIGFAGMGYSLLIAVVLTAAGTLHLTTIRVEEDRPERAAGDAKRIDLKGTVRTVRSIDGLPTLLFFTTFNNLLGGVFMALMDPYGLSLMSVQAWGVMWACTNVGFIFGGLVVSRRGLGPKPLRVMLLGNLASWCLCIIFPVRSSITLLALAMLIFMTLLPAIEASEQTIIQRVVPFAEQGRVFGFAQTLETGASPITSFVLGPVTQVWAIPFMTDGFGADHIGSWFGTGPARGMALIFMIAGILGMLLTFVAMHTRGYDELSESYTSAARPDVTPAEPAAS